MGTRRGSKALFKEGPTEKAQRDLSALTGVERINILHHIGTKPLPNDQYGRLRSVIEYLPPGTMMGACLTTLTVDDRTFTFLVINQKTLFVRKCYHELYEIVIKSPTAVAQSGRVLLTDTPGIGKSTFLVHFIIRVSA
jgi:hypothetical protein